MEISKKHLEISGFQDPTGAAIVAIVLRHGHLQMVVVKLVSGTASL